MTAIGDMPPFKSTSTKDWIFLELLGSLLQLQGPTSRKRAVLMALAWYDCESDMWLDNAGQASPMASPADTRANTGNQR